MGYSKFGKNGLICSIKIQVGRCYDTCNGPFDNNCITCKENTKRKNGDDERCFARSSTFSNMFFDEENDRFDYCYHSCESCDEKGNNEDHKCNRCLSYYYKKEYAPSYNCYYNPLGYYLDYSNGEYLYKKCFPTCASCVLLGNEYDNKCLTCKPKAVYISGQCEHICESNECFYDGECFNDYAHL